MDRPDKLIQDDLKFVLREMLAKMDEAPQAQPAVIREHLRGMGFSERLISDAMFVLDILGDPRAADKSKPRPSRVLSDEERRHLDPAVGGKVLQLYYLGFIDPRDLETLLHDLLAFPPERQNERTREMLASICRLSREQADFLMDGGLENAALH